MGRGLPRLKMSKGYAPKLTPTGANGLPKYEGGVERIHARLGKPIKIF